MNTPTHRGSIRRQLPAGPPASRPSQVPRHSNMTAVSDLPPVPMSPPIRLPNTSLPSLPSSAQAPPLTSAQAPPPLSAQAPDSLMIDDNRSQPSHAIVPLQTNLALAQVHANTSAMGESERRSMQSQIDALRNQLSWTQNEAERIVYEEKMKAARTVQETLDKYRVKYTQACKEYDHQYKLMKDADQLQMQAMDNAARQQIAAIKRPRLQSSDASKIKKMHEWL